MCSYAECRGAIFKQVKPHSRIQKCRYGRVYLCKGQALKDYMKERSEKDGVAFSRVIYLGDGKNDYCPMADLKATDLVICSDFLAENGTTGHRG